MGVIQNSVNSVIGTLASQKLDSERNKQLAVSNEFKKQELENEAKRIDNEKYGLKTERKKANFEREKWQWEKDPETKWQTRSEIRKERKTQSKMKQEGRAVPTQPITPTPTIISGIDDRLYSRSLNESTISFIKDFIKFGGK